MGPDWEHVQSAIPAVQYFCIEYSCHTIKEAFLKLSRAGMAELADAADSKSSKKLSSNHI
jgi:hypothetical protein